MAETFRRAPARQGGGRQRRPKARPGGTGHAAGAQKIVESSAKPRRLSRARPGGTGHAAGAVPRPLPAVVRTRRARSPRGRKVTEVTRISAQRPTIDRGALQDARALAAIAARLLLDAVAGRERAALQVEAHCRHAGAGRRAVNLLGIAMVTVTVDELLAVADPLIFVGKNPRPGRLGPPPGRRTISKTSSEPRRKRGTNVRRMIADRRRGYPSQPCRDSSRPPAWSGPGFSRRGGLPGWTGFARSGRTTTGEAVGPVFDPLTDPLAVRRSAMRCDNWSGFARFPGTKETA
jgi:hypothetical protein